MKGVFSGSRLTVLAIRALLGIAFGFLLKQFFFPAAGMLTVLVIAGLLVFFAYMFESVRKDGNSRNT